MPDGGNLDITAGTDAEKKLVIVTIKDTGPGIDQADLPHIFEPFVTTKDEGYGVGLGLSTVYGIMERHGGSVDAYSRPGQGAAFTLKLPVNGSAAGSNGELRGDR
jgi:signal transduction histidine kinase